MTPKQSTSVSSPFSSIPDTPSKPYDCQDPLWMESVLTLSKREIAHMLRIALIDFQTERDVCTLLCKQLRDQSSINSSNLKS